MGSLKCVRIPTGGDSFMMPRGCKCTWDVKAPLRKLYVVLTAEGYRE